MLPVGTGKHVPFPQFLKYLIKCDAIDQRRLDHYDELKDVVRLMSRALTLQDIVSEGEYTGLFNVKSSPCFGMAIALDIL